MTKLWVLMVSFPDFTDISIIPTLLRVGEKLCLLVCVRFLGIGLRTLLSHTPCDLPIFSFMITFASYFTTGKALGGEHSQNVGLDLAISSS